MLIAPAVLSLVLGAATSLAFAANFWQPLCPDGGLCSSYAGAAAGNAEALVSFSSGGIAQRQLISLTTFARRPAGFVCASQLPSMDCFIPSIYGGSVFDATGKLLRTFNPRGFAPVTALEMGARDLGPPIYFPLTDPPVIVWGVGAGGGTFVYLTRDEAVTWEQQVPNVPMAGAGTTFALSPDGQRIWVIPGPAAPGLWQTPLLADTAGRLDFTRLARVDDGSFPAQVTQLISAASSATAAGDYRVALAKSGMFVSIDHGRSWTPSTFGGLVDAFVFPYAGNADTQAIAAHSTVFLSRDRGLTWKELGKGLPSARYELSADNGRLVAAGDGSFICRALDCEGPGFARVIPFGTSYTLVTEFYNATLEHFFMTGDDFEKYFVRSGGAGPGWIETGQSFWAWSQGWARESAYVCRFYGDPLRGPNSHFFSASTAECRGLLDLQSATPDGVPRWNSEGYAFKVSLPDAAGSCAPGLLPVHRAYNDGFARGSDGNHRYVLDASLLAPLVASGWKREGVAFCVPPAGHE